MKTEQVLYAQRVAKVGSKLDNTGKKFGEISTRDMSTLEKISGVKIEYERGLKELEDQEAELKGLSVPDLLRDEHKILISNFSEYVDSVRLMIKALDVENVQVDEDLYQEGIEKQQNATKGIVEVTDKMARKLNIK